MTCPVELPELSILSFPSAILCVWQQGWFLLVACFFAGVVDSIGGGGGLISVPALMTARVPNLFLLGTNKSISSMGSAVAVMRYAQAGLIPRLGARSWALLIAGAILGGAVGAAISQLALILENLGVLVPVLLVFVMVFLSKKWFWDERVVAKKPETLPKVGTTEIRSQRSHAMVCLIATYDGVFGPGTGTFFLSFLESLGFSTLQANAITKVFNLSSNVGALLFFAANSRVIWPVGMACAAAIMFGNFVGSTLALKKGKNLVRATVLLTTTAMLVRYFLLH